MSADDVVLDVTPGHQQRRRRRLGMPVIAVCAGVFALAPRIGRMLRPGVARR